MIQQDTVQRGGTPTVEWASILDKCGDVENTVDLNLRTLSSQVFIIEGLLHLHTWNCSISEHEIGIAKAGFLSLVVKVTFITSSVHFNPYQSRSRLQTFPKVITLTPHFCLLGSASLKGLFAVHLSIYKKLAIELCQILKKLYERSVVSISYSC